MTSRYVPSHATFASYRFQPPQLTDRARDRIRGHGAATYTVAGRVAASKAACDPVGPIPLSPDGS